MRKVKMLTVVSLLLIGSSSLAFAAPDRGMEKGGCGDRMMNMGQRADMGMFGGLDLTQEQRQQIKEIMSQYRKAQTRPAEFNKNSGLYNLITADEFDEAQVRKQIEEDSKQQIERRVQMAKIHHQMYQVLTPEQKAKAKARHEQRMENWKQKIESRAKNTPKQQ